MLAVLALLATTSADVMAKYECGRCHEGPTLTSTADRGCVACHRAIFDGSLGAKLGTPLDASALSTWRTRITHFVDVPSLTGLDHRVRRSWIEGFLAKPHDVRPGLSESMPRLPVTAEDAEAIARVLVPHEPDERPVEATQRIARPPSLEEGRALLEERGCAVCHRFSGVPPLRAQALPSDVAIDAARLARGIQLAPDLRHARARMTERSIVMWLADPRAMKADATMPRIALTGDEARAIARYLLRAPLEANASEVSRAAPEPTAARPTIARAVRFDEVNDRVFRKSCRHCHADPGLAFDDGGPGNTGGFGYRGKRLSLASYEEINAGSTDDDGEARSIFAPLEDGPMKGVPRLLAHLRARRLEERGVVTEGIVGMPLALPSLGDDEMQLLEAWIAQGRPR